MLPPRLALVLTSSVIAIWLAPAAAVTDSGHTVDGAYGTVLADLDGAKGPPSPSRGGEGDALGPNGGFRDLDGPPLPVASATTGAKSAVEEAGLDAMHVVSSAGSSTLASTGDPVRLRNCHGWCCRLEILHRGEWGTVCDDHFSNTDANVACRQIGCDGGWAHGWFGGHYNRYSTPPSKIWMDDVGCNGWESALSSCRQRGWGSHNCHHNEDVGVCCHERGHYCRGAAPLRMTDCDGEDGCCRLEVQHDGKWGTICDDDFDLKEAQVACRQLQCGTEGVRRVYSLPEVASTKDKPIWLDRLRCHGSERGLSFCAHAGWGHHQCAHHHDVGLCCPGGCKGQGDPLRLVDCRADGCCRLNVNHKGVWGTVCDVCARAYASLRIHSCCYENARICDGGNSKCFYTGRIHKFERASGVQAVRLQGWHTATAFRRWCGANLDGQRLLHRKGRSALQLPIQWLGPTQLRASRGNRVIRLHEILCRWTMDLSSEFVYVRAHTQI